MNMNLLNSTSQLPQNSIFTDLSSLDAIRKQGLVDEASAIKKASQEFEALFLNMMLKSMRQSGELLNQDSMMGSQQEKMFISMMDEQLSVDLSHKGVLGIADLMVKQLLRNKVQPEVNTMQNSPAAKTAASEPFRRQASVPPLIKIDEQKQSLVSLAQNSKALNSSSVRISNASPVAEKKPLFSQISDFIKQLTPYAKAAAKQLNINPGILIAQSALETGWGKFIAHDTQGKPGFNLFGIKAGKSWTGEKIKISTLEMEGGKLTRTQANFRKYGNVAESFQDYVNFIQQNPRYQQAIKAKDSDQYVKELQKAGYATDPDYASKIIRIYKEHQLGNLNSASIETR